MKFGLEIIGNKFFEIDITCDILRDNFPKAAILFKNIVKI